MSENENNVDSSEKQEPKKKGLSMRKFFKYFSIVLLAFLVGYIHYQYVSHLFENDRYFSYLSEMEREMSLRTEMGFYYSYYKTIVQEQPFMAGISKLMNDRLVEFPNEVNAFNRFNIHPEVIIGALYRYMEPVLNTTSYRQCHMVERGEALAPVESCVGLGQPIIFYLEAVWLLAGLNVAALFLQATALRFLMGDDPNNKNTKLEKSDFLRVMHLIFYSESILGGVFAVAQYFANHAESTRVQWTPNERENMAAPLLLMQLWLVSLQLRDRQRRTTLQLQVSIFLLNCLCLLFWQFTQFIFLTQLAIFFMMEQLRVIDLKTFCVLLHSHFCGLHMAVLLLQGNDMLKSSFYTSLFIVLSVYCMFFSSLSIKVENRMDLLVESWLVLLRIGIVATSSFYLKKVISDFLDVNEDSHVWDMLRAKLTDFRSFHTLLYTCSDVFDFLPLTTVKKLCLSFLIPFVVLSVTIVIKTWLLNAVRDCSKDMSETEDGAKPKREQDSDTKESDKENTSDEDSGIENSEVRTHTEVDLINKRLSAEIPEKDVLICFLRNLVIDPAVFYNVSQMVVYGVMAALVMRLKLLFVPQMCVVSALMMNKDYYKLPNKYMRYIPLFRIICLLPVIQSVMTNVTEEMSHIGEFSDPQQEKLMEWIMSQSSNSVYAGSLPLLASIMLVTRRAVVAHPHYEHENARQRAYTVYKAYGRFTAEELYEGLSKLRATHLVVENKYCYGKSSNGCTFLDLWDAEVGHSKRPALCHTLLRGRTNHFYPVYRDDHYSVFRVHDYGVRYMPRSFDT